jgi:acetoacetyl-CoA synthetase
MGVGRGDRVAAFMPNIPETIAAFLATASLGAIWSSCSPDFGVGSVVDRFSQIEPSVLLAVDGYRYGGKDFDRTAVISELAASLPTVRRTVVLPYLGSSGDWDEAFPPTGEPLTFERVEFDHPLWVLYSSGTTGLPKAIVHGHGGILLEHLKQSAPAPQCSGRRPDLLVHQHGLDDVELPGVGAAHARGCGPL